MRSVLRFTFSPKADAGAASASASFIIILPNGSSHFLHQQSHSISVSTVLSQYALFVSSTNTSLAANVETAFNTPAVQLRLHIKPTNPVTVSDSAFCTTLSANDMLDGCISGRETGPSFCTYEPEILGACLTAVFVAAVSVFLQLYVRMKIIKVIGDDDWAASFAMVSGSSFTP